MELGYGMICDKGDVRQDNQDSTVCLYGMIGNIPSGLFIVADGMGGMAFGGWVSQYIAEVFERWWREELPQLLLEEHRTDEELDELLEQEIWYANQEILAFGKARGKKCGSTLSLLLVIKNKLFIKNLGDSRVYRLRNGRLCQLTQDQTAAAMMTGKHAAELSRHALTMCMGVFRVPETYSVYGEAFTGDCYLVCSDGLYSCLDDEEIGEELNVFEETEQETAARLRSRIPVGKARDNVSAIVVRIKGSGRGSER